MGICASCLGQNRHPSREVDESDPLLDDAQAARYGAVREDEVAQPDEEELEREREALSRITALATESMIDVSHPSAVTINHSHNHNSLRGSSSGKHDDVGSQSTITASNQGAEDAGEDAEEQAWLDSITSTEPGSVTQIKPLQKGALVMDIGQLRESAPPPSARKPSRAGVGRY